MRNWIQQKPNKKNCGVIAVAVIASIPVNVAAEYIGKDGATTTKQLVKALRKLGYKCPDRLKVMPRPPLAIAKLVSKKRKGGWHWVVVDGDKIFDGINGKPDGTVDWYKDDRITSYLPITQA
jgi:hypothetical protein